MEQQHNSHALTDGGKLSKRRTMKKAGSDWYWTSARLSDVVIAVQIIHQAGHLH
jgi:hypothetical protein